MVNEELDCSDGAKMLIERMKEYPQEFKYGYNTKFGSILQRAHERVEGAKRDMSLRDAKALIAAAETHLYEAWLAEEVINNLMQPKPERKQVQVTPRPPGKSYVADQERARREMEEWAVKYRAEFERVKLEQLRYSPTDKYDILDRKPWI